MPPDTEAVQTTALHPAARPRGFRTRSLRASLTVWLGALGVLPALAATIVTAMAFSHLQRHAEVRRTTAAADSAAQGVAAACRRLEQAADAAAREHALSAAVGAGEAALQRVCAAIVAQQNVAGVAVYGGRSQLLGQSGEAPAPLAVPAWRRGREDDPNALHFIPGRGGGLWVAAHAELATDVAASGKSRGLVVVFLRLGDAFCAAQSENAGAEVFLYGTQGEVLARSSFPPPASDLAALARSEESHAELTISGHGYLVASRAVLARGRPSGVMVGAMSGRQEWRGALYRSGWLVLGMLGGVVLVALGTGAALARRIAEPMVEIANAAHGLAAGDLGRRARVDGHDEIRSLAESFNYMAGRRAEHALA
jgi:HAMP domain-containing protein